MIEMLRGILAENDGAHIVVDVHGIGFGADVPASTANELPAIGEEVQLFTYFYVQENVVRLYAFRTRQERDIFEIFIGVSGIGPKTALGILSAVRIRDFVEAVLGSDVSQLTKIPGVGKKTAERLIVELRDKVKHWGVSAATPRRESSVAVPRRDMVLRDVSAALQALGCKAAIADRAAERALEKLGEDAPLESLVREALRHRY
jgi:Holliday junction DNA helicase RuvA